MSEYVNQANVNIGEMVRLHFNDVKPDSTSVAISELVMHYEFFKVLHSTIGNTIAQYETNLANANKEKDKDLN